MNFSNVHFEELALEGIAMGKAAEFAVMLKMNPMFAEGTDEARYLGQFYKGF